MPKVACQACGQEVVRNVMRTHLKFRCPAPAEARAHAATTPTPYQPTTRLCACGCKRAVPYSGGRPAVFFSAECYGQMRKIRRQQAKRPRAPKAVPSPEALREEQAMEPVRQKEAALRAALEESEAVLRAKPSLYEITMRLLGRPVTIEQHKEEHNGRV